jgi:hypothetical protein
MQHRLIVDTDISGQHTTPTFKAHALQTQAFILEWLPFRMGPNVALKHWQPTISVGHKTSKQRKGLNSTAEEALNHTICGTLKY